MKSEADGLDHGDVGVLVAVAEVQPCPQDGIIAQLVPINIKIICTQYSLSNFYTELHSHKQGSRDIRTGRLQFGGGPI